MGSLSLEKLRYESGAKLGPCKEHAAGPHAQPKKKL
jgi:hypothetical protein